MKPIASKFALKYLKFFAKLQLRKYAPDTVGITGTAGKTSTLLAVNALLSSKYKTKVSYKANSEWGIPMDILAIKPYRYTSTWKTIAVALVLAPWRVMTLWEPYEKYLVEMGIDGPVEPQNMSYLLSIVRPRTAIFLNVEPMHSAAFDHLVKETDPSLRRQRIRHVIGDEKAKLVTSVPKDSGLAILNADDDIVFSYKDLVPGKTMVFGKHGTVDLKIGKITQSLQGTSIEFSTPDESSVLSLTTYLLPDHFASSFAASLCIGLDEGYSLNQSIKILAKNFTLPPGRASLIPGIKGSLILDSSYNASAKPTIDFLDLVGRIKGGLAYALLGDMRELGLESLSEHEMVARAAASVCDRVYLVGPLMKQFALPIIQEKLKSRVSWYETTKLAALAIKQDLKPATLVLVKGSQNTLFLEAAVEILMSHPQKAEQLLCRRGPFWDVKRAEARIA